MTQEEKEEYIQKLEFIFKNVTRPLHTRQDSDKNSHKLLILTLNEIEELIYLYKEILNKI